MIIEQGKKKKKQVGFFRTYFYSNIFGLLMLTSISFFFNFNLIVCISFLCGVFLIQVLSRFYHCKVKFEPMILLLFYMPPIKIDIDDAIARVYDQCYRPLVKFWNDSWYYPGEGEIPEPYVVKERVNYFIGDVLELNPHYTDYPFFRIPFRHYEPGSYVDDLEVEPYLYGLRWGLEHMPGTWSGLDRLNLIDPLREGFFSFFDSSSGIGFHFYSFYFVELGLTGAMFLYLIGRFCFLLGPILMATAHSHLKGQVLARILSDRARNGQLDVYDYWNSLPLEAQMYYKQRLLGYVHLKGIYVETLYLDLNQCAMWNLVESLLVDSFHRYPITMKELVYACIQVGFGYVDTLCVIYLLIFK